MTRAAWVFAAAAGVLLAAGAGCYHPSPYGPNRYPTYQTMPPGSFQAAPPAGSFVVPGGTVPGTLGAPSNTFQGPGPTLAPPINGGDAPPYTFEQGAAPSSGGTVPNYSDPNAGDFNNSNPGMPPDDGFQRPGTGGSNGSPFYEGTALPRSQPYAQAAPVRSSQPNYFSGLDQFDAAGNRQPTAGSRVSPASYDRVSDEDFGVAPKSTPQAAATQPAEEEGFDYDRSAYRWLRGVVDFDPQHKDWHIIYGLPPDPQDKYAGSLTLVDGGHLKDFQSDDVVYVEGRLDATARDVLGKPVFRVSRAELLGRFE